MQNKMTKGIFEDKKARLRYEEVVVFIKKEQRKILLKSVTDLYQRKATSEPGEFTVFGITVEDINNIIKTLR